MTAQKDLGIDLAFLSRREKRLKYWREQFNSMGLQKAKLAEINALLGTCSLLIAKIVKSHSDVELVQCESRLQAAERELTSLFESARQETGPLNTAGGSGAPTLRG